MPRLRHVPALLIVTALPTAGCGALGFEVSQDIPEQRVSGAAANPIVGLLPDFLRAPVPITVDLASETKKRDTGPATAAFLSALRLAATPHDAPSGNFDFLDEVHVFVEAQQSANLPRREIATLKPVPRGQTTVDFAVVPGVDLLPYLQPHEGASDRAQMTATASGHQPAKDFTYDGTVTIEIRL